VTNTGLWFSAEKSNVKNTDNQTTYPTSGVRDSSDIEQGREPSFASAGSDNPNQKDTEKEKKRKRNTGLHTHMLKNH
jgi:hypothetical protein